MKSKLLFFSVILCLIFFLSALGEAHLLHYKIWADRDLYRASNLFAVFQVYGPEMSNSQGARIPGGAYYYLLRLLMVISETPEFIAGALLALNMVVTIFLYDLGRRLVNPFAGIATVILYVTAESFRLTTAELWNPIAAAAFGTIAYYFIIRSAVSVNIMHLVLGFFTLGLAAQMQVSYFFLIPTFLFLLIFLRHLSLRHAVLAILAVFTAYLPYLLSFTGFFQAEPPMRATIAIALPPTSSFQPVEWLMHAIKQAGQLGYADLNSRIFLPFLSFAGVWLVTNNPKLQRDVLLSDERLNTLRLVFTMLFACYFIIVCLADGIVRLYLNIQSEGITGRYFIFLLPISSILGGTSLSVLVYYSIMKRDRVFITISAASVAVLLLLPLSVQSYLNFKNYFSLGLVEQSDTFRKLYNHSSFDPLSRKRQLFNDVVANFGYGPDDIRSRLSVLRMGENGKFRFEDAAGEYLMGSMNFLGVGKAISKCVVAISKISANYDYYYSAEELVSHLKNSDNWFLQLVSLNVANAYESSNALLVPLDNISSCPTSVSNHYLITAEEAALDQELAHLNDKVVVFQKLADRERYVFGEVMEGRFPLRISLEILHGDEGLRVRIVSKQLRNITWLDGYWSQHYFREPVLKLQPTNGGAPIRLKIIDGTLGSDGFYTPWISRPFKIEPGEYDLLLEGQMGLSHAGNGLASNLGGSVSSIQWVHTSRLLVQNWHSPIQ